MPFLDIAPILDGFPSEPVTWLVYPTATIDPLFGEKADGTATDVPDVVVLHPATRRQIASPHDGADHAVEPLAVYTTSAVYAGGEQSAPTEMVRDSDGRRYEVVNVGDYQAQGGVTLVLLSLVADPPP